MLHKIVRLLPPGFIRAVGRLQFQYPWLGKLIRGAATAIASNEGVIANGVGKGLKFNATGGYAGYLLGTTEVQEQEAFASFLKPGGVFYDLGANIGFYSTLAGGLVGPSGAVYAFEPFPESAARARHNAQLNGFAHVQVIESALSDVNGTVRFALQDKSASHRIDAQDTTTLSGIEVPSVTLDTAIAQHGLRPPSLIMIDIEGAEFAAIRGMTQTLAAHRPVVMVEVHWLIEELHETFATVLEPLGYTMRNLDGGPLPTEKIRYHVVFEPRVASVPLT